MAGISFRAPTRRHLYADWGTLWVRRRGAAAVEGGRVPRFSPNGKWIAYLNTSEDRGHCCVQLEHAVPRAGTGRRAGTAGPECIVGAGGCVEGRPPERTFPCNRRT